MATQFDLASKLTNYKAVQTFDTFTLDGSTWSTSATVPKNCVVLVMFNIPFNSQTIYEGNYFGWGYLRLWQNGELIMQPIFEGARKADTNIGLTALLNCNAGDVIKIEIVPQNQPESWYLRGTTFFIGEV